MSSRLVASDPDRGQTLRTGRDFRPYSLVEQRHESDRDNQGFVGP
jgi:hypothetical protein